MAADYGSGVAANVTSTIIVAIFNKLRDVIELEGNLKILDTDFSTMKDLLSHIRNQFQDQQKRMEKPLEKCLKNMDSSLEEAKDLIDRAKRHSERGCCFRCCCFLCKIRLSTQIRVWKPTYDGRLQDLERVFSIYAATTMIVSNAAHQADLLLQPVPESGFIGLGIRSAQDQLQRWLTEPHYQAPVIGVHGMAGVGKTSLLRLIYNTYKKEVSGIFDVVIWVTVSQNFQIKELQASIAEELGLNMEKITNTEMRKMKMYEYLQRKRFLIILDDVWSPIDLNEVGVSFGDDKHSKIIVSSRSRDVIEGMKASEYSVNIKPLTRDEEWELFTRGAFTNGVVPENSIKATATQIARECRGLPLAINAVAAAMRCKHPSSYDEWSRALDMMKKADPGFPATHKTIDAELYQKLKWSYDDLRDPNLKLCFLYFAAFAEDQLIAMEDVVQMWSGEGLVSKRDTTYLMDTGREYTNLLVSRCLIEYYDFVSYQHRFLKIHDVLRDMAIYIGEREENWLLAAGQNLRNFPSQKETRDRKRISVAANDIHDLPNDFSCPNLVSLLMAGNKNMGNIPQGFLSDLMCLRVLDLSFTSIKSLPNSVGRLGQLEFLNLSNCTSLKDLPETICNLDRLHFLNLEQCTALRSLPIGIGKLKNLKHLNLKECKRFRTIPNDIFQLTSLDKLFLPLQPTCTVNAEDLTNLSNLIELQVIIKAEIKVGILGPWVEMRTLKLKYNHAGTNTVTDGVGQEDSNTDELAQNNLRESIKHMKKLESLSLINYQGLTLPNCICDFQNMKGMFLRACHQLRELPAAHGSFPMLQNLILRDLKNLESITGPIVMWNEGAIPGTMSKLEYLCIDNCPFVKKLLLTVEKLPNLRQTEINYCNELQELDFRCMGFPMLKYLSLHSLNNLDSIGGPFGMWDERTLPKLETLSIEECSLLKKLPLGIEKLSNLRQIKGELNWWQSLQWEDHERKNTLSQLFREVDY